MITEQLGGYSVAELKINNSVSFTEEQCPDLSGIIVKGKTSTMKGIEAVIKPDVEESLPVTDFVKDNNFSFKNIENLVIPKGVTKIGDNAFRDYENLTSVEIPDSVTEIGEYAFYQCRKLTSIRLPKNIKKLGNYCFYHCDLKSITIPNSLEVWKGDYPGGGRCFAYNEHLADITLENGITYIGDGAFADSHDITSIKIPGGVTKICEAAFRDAII